MPQSNPRSLDSRINDTTRNSGDLLEGTTLDSGSRDGEQRHLSRRRRNNRTSSSFLLEPRGSDPDYPGEQEEREGASEESAQRVLPKRHATIDRKHNRSSVGSSPLALSMTNAREEVSRDGVHTMAPSSPGAPSVCLPESFGLDTDPAQIVNLALSLSDSRRRSTSGRVVSSLAPKSTRVLSRNDISTDSYEFPKQDTVDFQRHSPQDPQIPSRLVPGSGIGGQVLVATRPSQSLTMEKFVGSAIADTNSKQYEYMPYDISSATLARAEKTRKHFELFAEYLRLLPHLPPLPNLNELSVPAGNSSTRDRTTCSHGRVYNPLQYIRNRKVRFREKCPIDSEADGWENLDKVRNWVDLITSSDENPTHEPEHCILLPRLDSDNRPDTRLQTVTAAPSTTRVLSGADSNKPRRPRVDWITSPADFLADAAWLEEGSNKLKIEDRDGKRIFNPDTSLKPVPLRGLEPPTTEQPTLTKEKMQEQHAPLAERLPPHEILPSFKPLPSRSHTGTDRGRRSPRITSSAHLSPSGPSSRETSKSRWRRALSRSSDSSSESSSDEHGRHRGRRLPTTVARNDTDLQIERHTSTPGDKTQPPVLPFLDTAAGQGRPISSSHKYIRSASSSSSERRKIDCPQSSVAAVDGSPGSALTRPQAPDFALNRSPPPSRPPSPTKSPLSRLVGSGKRLAYNRTNSGLPGIVPADHSAPELAPHNLLADSDAPLGDSDTKVALYNEGKARVNESYHPESPTRSSKYQSPHESKLRGIFKSGRLAEIVGNEVSKVGDYIWKKDGSGHSRHSSAASSEIFSDYVDADDDLSEAMRKQRPHLSRFPTLSDNVSLSRRNSKKDLAKYHTPNLPMFVSPPKRDDRGASPPASDFDTPSESGITQQPLGGEFTAIRLIKNCYNHSFPALMGTTAPLEMGAPSLVALWDRMTMSTSTANAKSAEIDFQSPVLPI
ncbi:hypothetical protein ACJ72_00633 [Emergomyces africanus]|uniref:Uncharacterized protein n=1 Tax=Emergomyces africanus TaxID=1955775 RepID=A0A1B7P7K6_9EURO|nr:hypothetical protein ACJ72_00633 [Emergomyces africanus]